MPHKWISAIIIFQWAMTAIPSPAVELIHTNEWHLREGQTLSEEHWVWAPDLHTEGMIEAPLSALCNTAEVSGDIAAQTWLAALETLRWTGRASRPVRFAGRYVELQGEAQASLVAAGQTISLDPSARFHQGVALLGLTIVADGEFSSNVWISANSVTLKGTYHGPLYVSGADIQIAPGTVIRGPFTYSSPEAVHVGSKVDFQGELIRKPIPRISLPKELAFSLFFSMFASAVLVGIPFVRFCPRTVLFSGSVTMHSPIRCLLVGFSLFWLSPVLLWSLFRFPPTRIVGIVFAAMVLLLIYLSQVIIALLIGGGILRRWKREHDPHVFFALLIGLIVLYMATLVPILNMLAWAVVMTLGLGSLVMGLWNSQKIQILASPQAEANEAGGPPNETDSGNP